MFCNKKCPLLGSLIVPGRGSPTAELMIVGEAPRFLDEETGMPFSGRSEKDEIDKILREYGVSRDSLFLDYIVHCRPCTPEGKDREPTAKEINSCRHYLSYNILSNKPKIVLTLGKLAARTLLKKSDMKKLRGKYHLWNGIPILVTYHPTEDSATMMRFFRMDLKKALNYISIKEPDIKKYTIATKTNYKKILEYLIKSKSFSFDIETNGKSWKNNTLEIVSIAISPKCGEAYYFDFREIDLKELKPLLESSIPKIGQNVKFDALCLRNKGIVPNALSFDTMLAAHLLDSNRPSKDLKSLAADFTTMGGYECTLEEYLKENKDIGYDYSKIPKEILSHYNMSDADATRRIYQYQLKELRNEEKLNIYQYVMIPTLNTLIDIEERGMLINTETLSNLENQYKTIVDECRLTLARFKGVKLFEKEKEKLFNPESGDHVGKIVFRTKKSNNISEKTGKPVVDKRELNKLSKSSRFIREVLKFRDYNKEYTTYLIGIKENLYNNTLHPNFWQTIATSYRLSCTDPNLQNIPERGHHKIIKNIFIPRPGYVIVSADYSQIELRILATMSGDQALIDVFTSGTNPFIEIGSALFKIAKEKVTLELIARTKTFLYGTIYGASATGMAWTLNLPKSVVDEIQKNFFTRYSGARHYMDNIKSIVMATGKVEAPTGATRVLPDGTRKQLRQAINFPIQHTAGAILFMAMNRMNSWKKKNNINMYLLNTIHDQILVEVHNELMPDILPKIKRICESIPPKFTEIFNYTFATTLPVKITHGMSWGELHS